MRVGFFLLLSIAVHMAAGHWLDWQPQRATPMAAAVAQARVLSLPVLAEAARAAEPPVEAPEPPEPQPVTEPPAPAPVAQQQPTLVEPARPAVAPPAVKPPVAEPVVEAAAASASAPRVASEPQPALPVAEPEQEVVNQAPRFREPPAAPAYPVQAQRRNQQGQVLVEVRLDAEGEQRQVRLLKSSGFSSLDRAALEAVADWKFQPERQAGRPTPSRVQIPIDFALNTRR